MTKNKKVQNHNINNLKKTNKTIKTEFKQRSTFIEKKKRNQA